MMMLFAAALAASAPGVAEPTLDEVRARTSRFKDVQVALAEGYVADPTNVCHTAAHMGRDKALGGMGIHYFRPDLLGIKGPPNPRVSGDGLHTDFRQPSILIYEPNAKGDLELVAVENLVFEKAWRASGNVRPPSFRGVTWDHMVDDPATTDDEAHGFEPHFDLHVWLHRDNPAGMFKPFNPRVTCEHAQPAMAHSDHKAGSGHAEHAAH